MVLKTHHPFLRPITYALNGVVQVILLEVISGNDGVAITP
jgi:hypothetical protein